MLCESGQKAGFNDAYGKFACDTAFYLDMVHICETYGSTAELLGEIECLGAAAGYMDAMVAAIWAA